MKIRVDAVVAATLVVCAVVTTGFVVSREFMTPARLAQGEQKPALIPQWQKYIAAGERMGPPRAPVQFIEFADFECPYCGSFHGTLKTLRERYPTQVSLTYVHFLIPGHRFALPAARVAECAGDQGRFEAMYDQLFDGQDSFGLKPWNEYATAAGVPDLGQFDACIKKADPIPRVEAGKELGAKLDVRSTPTLIVNGWKLGRPPSVDELDAMVKAVLAGKSPVGSTKS